MLIKAQKRESKNRAWEDYSPNMLANNENLSHKVLGSSYRRFADKFAARQGIDSHTKFLEVRIIGGRMASVLALHKCWWLDPLFMDTLFWVFAGPQKIQLDGRMLYCYALEPMECARVAKSIYDRDHVHRFSSPFPGLWVPVEETVLAHTERSAGISDHLRIEPNDRKSKEELESEANWRERVESHKSKFQDADLDFKRVFFDTDDSPS